MEPFNYSAQLGLDGPNVGDSYLKGLAANANLQDMRLNQQAAQAKLQAQQAAQEQAAKQQQMLADFSNNPNPTAEDYAKITRAMPQLSEGFKRSWDILQPAQRDAHWNETVQVYAATLNNKPEVAAKILNEKAAAFENSGDPAKAEQARKMAQLAIDDPEYAKKTAYLSLYSFDPDKAQKLAQSLDSQAAAAATLPGQIADSTSKVVAAKFAPQVAALGIEKAGKEIKDIGSRIAERGARLALDTRRLNNDIQTTADNLALKYAEFKRTGNDLPGDVRKLVTENTLASSASKVESDAMKDLAGRISMSGANSGLVGSASEVLKKVTGSQDYNTELRKEYARIRSQGIIKSLPPGPATDRDIEQASRGFLEENANPKTIASFLRGMAKIRDVESQMQQINADFAEQNRGVGRARSDMKIGQYTVKQGDSLADVYKQIKVTADAPAATTDKPAAKPRAIVVDY